MRLYTLPVGRVTRNWLHTFNLFDHNWTLSFIGSFSLWAYTFSHLIVAYLWL